MLKINMEKLLETLNTKWANKRCPMCGENDWNLQDKVFELREYNNGGLIIGNVPIVPVVPITCTNCGNVIFVNPMIASEIEE